MVRKLQEDDVCKYMYVYLSEGRAAALTISIPNSAAYEARFFFFFLFSAILFHPILSRFISRVLYTSSVLVRDGIAQEQAQGRVNIRSSRERVGDSRT